MSYVISVVVCTYNRAEMLDATLESWKQVDVAGMAVEFLVVDNASTDKTKEVVQAHQAGFGTDLRYVFEPQAGLSNARNRGISEAAASIIAFVDDDIYFDPGWLRSVMAAFDHDPEIQCIGGKTIPTFEIPRPEWITDAMLKYYGSTMSGECDRPMIAPEHPFGVNMIFRKSVFDRLGPFRTNLGRVKTSLLSNEESELFHRIHAAGLRVWYASQAVIYHRIPAERLEKRWLLRRAYWQGISSVITDAYMRSRSKADLLRDSIRNVRRLLLGPGRRSPGRIYLYYRNFSFVDRIVCYKYLGAIRQSMIELFRNRRY
jgi:glucosyl-dolichyl phosphate glucuronosyltransferase